MFQGRAGVEAAHVSQCVSSYQKLFLGDAPRTQDQGQLATVTGMGVRGSRLGMASFLSGPTFLSYEAKRVAGAP